MKFPITQQGHVIKLFIAIHRLHKEFVVLPDVLYHIVSKNSACGKHSHLAVWKLVWNDRVIMCVRWISIIKLFFDSYSPLVSLRNQGWHSYFNSEQYFFFAIIHIIQVKDTFVYVCNYPVWLSTHNCNTCKQGRLLKRDL